MERPGVKDVVVHMCQFGLTLRDHFGEGPAKKPTRIITNLSSIAEAVDRKCSRDHRHVEVKGGIRSRQVGAYSHEFASALVDGIACFLEHENTLSELFLMGFEFGIEEVDCEATNEIDDEFSDEIATVLMM